MSWDYQVPWRDIRFVIEELLELPVQWARTPTLAHADAELARQLVDDALDYSGRQALMGKTVGDDFREAKMTLPLILAYARARDADRPFWKRVIETGNQTESDLDRAITLIEQTGAMQETMSRARAYADVAKAALKVMPDSDIKRALADIADFCVERAY